jgi:hypothetical protein
MVVMNLYRGTIAYDPPLKVRADSGSGLRHDSEYSRLKAARWRDNHREELRTYNREYMRKWRAARRRASCLE